MERRDRKSGSTATPTTQENRNHLLARWIAALRGFSTLPNIHVCATIAIICKQWYRIKPKPTVEKKTENRYWKKILAKQLQRPNYWRSSKIAILHLLNKNLWERSQPVQIGHVKSVSLNINSNKMGTLLAGWQEQHMLLLVCIPFRTQALHYSSPTPTYGLQTLGD